DSFPKDELFAATAAELRATIMALLGMQEEGGVRLFLRRDPVRRTVAAVVALPRDHVSTELRIRLEHLFELRFGGRAVDYTPSFGPAATAATCTTSGCSARRGSRSTSIGWPTSSPTRSARSGRARPGRTG